MDGLNRRDAIRLVAAGGIVATSVGTVAAQDPPAEAAADPAGWGKNGDRSFRVGDVGETVGKPEGGRADREAATLRALRSNNCNEKKDEISGRFDIAKFGNCYHPTPIDADVEAAVLMAQVIAEGGVLNTEFGHRTVRNRLGPVSYNTYLSYAGGDTI